MSTEAHCKVEKCKGEIRAKNYCDRHYRKWRRGELPKSRYRICKAEACRKPMVAQGLCQTHFDAWKASRKKVVRLLKEQEKVKAPPAAEAAPAPTPAAVPEAPAT